MNMGNRTIRFLSSTRHLAAVIATTIIAIAFSVYYLSSGLFIVFQNIFYFPIVIACIYYFKRGFVFSVLLAFIYFFLIVAHTVDPIIIRKALIRVVIFIFIAGVVTFVSLSRRKVENELRVSKNFTETVLNGISDHLFVINTSNFTIMSANEAFRNTYGQDKDTVIGKYCYEVTHKRSTPCVLPDDPCPLVETLRTGKPLKAEHIHYNSAGIKHFFEISVFPIRNKRGEIDQVVHIDRDITERKRMEQKLLEMATHDPLTGLPNRILLYDRFGIALANANRNKKKVAIMSLDLDRFKTINDTLGHDIGDKLLVAAAGRLTDTLRKSDTVARMGGDEFVLLLGEVDHNDDAVKVAEKIVNNFRQLFFIGEHSLNITVSIGIAIFPDDGKDIESLLKVSDKSLYSAKESGRDRFAL